MSWTTSTASRPLKRIKRILSRLCVPGVKKCWRKCGAGSPTRGWCVTACWWESGAGRVCEQVAEEARLVRADMIVLGSHGRRGLARVLMGSDAEQIVRHAPVPVLVVKG